MRNAWKPWCTQLCIQKVMEGVVWWMNEWKGSLREKFTPYFYTFCSQMGLQIYIYVTIFLPKPWFIQFHTWAHRVPTMWVIYQSPHTYTYTYTKFTLSDLWRNLLKKAHTRFNRCWKNSREVTMHYQCAKTLLFLNLATSSIFKVCLFAKQIKREVLQNKMMGRVSLERETKHNHRLQCSTGKGY